MIFRILLISLIVFGCSKYRGFKELDDVHYKIDRIGEDQHQIRGATYLEIEYKYCKTSKCKTTSEGQYKTMVKMEFPDSSLLSGLRIGDGLTFLIDSNASNWMTFFDIPDNITSWPVIIHAEFVGLLEKGTFWGKASRMPFLYQYQEDLKIASMSKEGEIAFIEENDVLISLINEGEGDSIQFGKEVILSYKGYFADGGLFDDTDQWKDTLKFSYGTPMQIIPGLEIGIQDLREGAEAKIIIPSHLAFGKEGSSSGLIPPYEPLLYHVKVESVKEKINEEI